MNTRETNPEQQKIAERLLVVGGGGARGAWAAGFAKYLRFKHGIPYRYAWGTSAGSLMAPFVVLDDFKTLEKAYTQVAQKDIFDVNPFTKKGDLNIWVALWRLIRKKKTFGESNNLLKLIKKYVTKERYETIINADPPLQFTVCSVNYRDGKIHNTASSQAVAHEKMINWIWASSNQPLLMTFVGEKYIEGGDYVDGGVMDTVPIINALKYAVNHNINDIDILVNTPEQPVIDNEFKPGSILKNFLRLIEFWRRQVQADDITIAQLLAALNISQPPENLLEDEKLNLCFHYFPSRLYKENFNDLIFNEGKLKQMWEAGEKGEHDAPAKLRSVVNEDNPLCVTVSKNSIRFQ